MKWKDVKGIWSERVMEIGRADGKRWKNESKPVVDTEPGKVQIRTERERSSPAWRRVQTPDANALPGPVCEKWESMCNQALLWQPFGWKVQIKGFNQAQFHTSIKLKASTAESWGTSNRRCSLWRTIEEKSESLPDLVRTSKSFDGCQLKEQPIVLSQPIWCCKKKKKNYGTSTDDWHGNRETD